MLTGLILAGGPNRRMDGKRKALLPFCGEKLVQRQVREMRKVCDEVIVATEDPLPFLRLVDSDVRIITDYYPGKGPLGGIHAGLSLAKHPSVWIVGCGMPFLSAAAACLLLQHKRGEAAVPVVRGMVSPLHGVYDKQCADAVLGPIERGERHVASMLKEMNWTEVDEVVFEQAGIHTNFALNILTTAQYEEALREASDLYFDPPPGGQAGFPKDDQAVH